MSDRIFIARDGQQQGPFSLDQVQQMAASHGVTPDSLCWFEGLDQWKPLGHALPQAFRSEATTALPKEVVAPAPAPAAAAAPTASSRPSSPQPRAATAAGGGVRVTGPTGTVMEVIDTEYYKLPKVTIANGEVVLEAGALHYMRGAITMESALPSVGGFLKSKLTGEKVVRPRYRGTGEIYLEPTFGEVQVMELKGETWILDKGAFMAAEPTVEIGMFTNKAITGLFGGEGFFQTQISGAGCVMIHAPGPLERLELVNDTLVVDGSFAVARTAGLEYAVERATKGIFSSIASGEGLVNTFRGTGTVLIAPVPNRFLTMMREFGGLRALLSAGRK